MRVVGHAVVALAVVAASVVVGLTGASPAAAAPHCVEAIDWQGAWVPASGARHPSCVMGQGSQSRAVEALQSSLNRCYRKSIALDHIFGPRTRQALREVQASLGIPDDGVYGPQTARAMVHHTPPVHCKRITF